MIIPRIDTSFVVHKCILLSSQDTRFTTQVNPILKDSTEVPMQSSKNSNSNTDMNELRWDYETKSQAGRINVGYYFLKQEKPIFQSIRVI